MEEKLNTIISHLEEEKKSLLKFIQNAVKDEEYLSAHVHFEALERLNSKLLTLRMIDDIYYDEKDFLSTGINRLEKDLDSELSEPMKAYWLQDLARNKKELARLNHLSKKANALGNSGILDETLSRLIQRKIKKFSLILNNKSNLLLEFSVSRNTLKLIFPDINKHLKNYVLHRSQIDFLVRLGFSLTNHDNKLVLNYALRDMESIELLKVILSRIVFEVFHFKEFRNESFIRIIK